MSKVTLSIPNYLYEKLLERKKLKHFNMSKIFQEALEPYLTEEAMRLAEEYNSEIDKMEERIKKLKKELRIKK